MTYQELREQIAKMMFHQTTMEHDWESRKDWVKDQYRKNVDEIVNLIQEYGWVIQPRDQNLPESQPLSNT